MPGCWYLWNIVRKAIITNESFINYVYIYFCLIGHNVVYLYYHLIVLTVFTILKTNNIMRDIVIKY